MMTREKGNKARALYPRPGRCLPCSQKGIERSIICVGWEKAMKENEAVMSSLGVREVGGVWGRRS